MRHAFSHDPALLIAKRDPITRGRCSTKDSLTLDMVVGHVKNLLKPCQEIFLSSTSFFLVETNSSNAFRNTTRPREVYMSWVSTMLTEERSNNPFSRLCHETGIEHQDINCKECYLALADILSQELETLASSTRTEPSKNVFEARNIVRDREHVVSEPSPVRY